MGSGQSTEEKESADHQKVTQTAQYLKEEQDKIREQRSLALRKKMEDQKREDQLKNQQSIDFISANIDQTQQQQVPQPNQEIKVSQDTKIDLNQHRVSQMIQQQQTLLSPKKIEADQSVNSQKLVEKIASSEQKQPQVSEYKEQIQAKPQIPVKQPITKEQRMHNFIQDVFLITNESSQANVNSDKKKTFLYEYCGEGKLFKLDDMDDIFLSRLSKNKDENKFIYLIQSYRRLENHLYVKQDLVDNVNDLKEQIVTYFNTCLQCPETFNLTNPSQQVLDNDGSQVNQQDMFMAMMQGGGQGMGMAFGEKLCSNQIFTFTHMQNQLYEAFDREAVALHTEFMRTLVNLVKGDIDQEMTLFQTLFDKLHINLNSIKIEKFRKAEQQLELLKILLDFKEAQVIFINSPHFIRPNINGKQIQQETYLGRYLSYTSLANETRGFKDTYFRQLSKTQHSGILKMVDSVSEQLHSLHRNIQEVMSKLLKNKDSKVKMLQWLRLAVGLNAEKQKMQTMQPVASDGFILNLMDVIFLFCKPFTSKFSEYHVNFPKVNCFYLMNDKYIVNASKIEKLDQDVVNQFINNTLFDPIFTQITQEPLQPSSLDQTVETENSQWEIPQPNFITECFFQAHLLVYFMSKKIEQQYEQLGKTINKAAQQKDFATYEEFMGMKMCLDAQLIGKNTLGGFRSLFTFTGAFFVALNNYEYYIPHADLFESVDVFQHKLIRLPIDPISNSPVDIAVLPACMIQNMAVYPKLFRQIYPESYYGKDIDLHMQVSTNVSVILNKRIKNPHIRAEMLQFLGYLVPQSVINKNAKRNPQQDREDQLYQGIFFNNVTLRNYLIEALVNVYIDCERTGYYEKNHFRFFASMIMEFIWSDNQYKQKFVQLGQEKPGLFIEFCNFLINDMNSLLFEGLLELEEIRDYEELQSSGDFNSLDQEQREQMTAKFDENNRKAKAHFQLSAMVVQLLAKVTQNFQAPFISDMLGEPFANALNFCMDSLVSQKGLKLKVANPERFNFDPRALTINILTMYANMSAEDIFLQHVVNDSRSYKSDTFEKAIRILNSPKKGVMLDQEKREKFEAMVEKLKILKNEIDQEEGMYDDAPEEFLDPLMSTLMANPVELPSSRTVIDYITIKKHLMNEPNDPFNRAPLTLEQLIPRNDLKQQIEEYKEKKKQDKLAMIMQ